MGDEHIEEARRSLFKNVSVKRREKQAARKGRELSHWTILTVITEEELQTRGYSRKQIKMTGFTAEDGRLVNNLLIQLLSIKIRVIKILVNFFLD